MLERLFAIDIERCPRCGGRLKIIAAVVDPQVIVQSSRTCACPPAPRHAQRRGLCRRSRRPDLYTE